MDIVGSLALDAETPEQHRRFAEQLIAWAGERHPADAADVTPAALLGEAGQILEILGDHAAALEVFRRAATAEGVVEPDVRCFLHRALMSVGDEPAARLLAEEVRRSASADPDVYATIGETYERAGDLREAHRWLNLALQRVGAEVPDDDERWGLNLLLLSIVRRRIRRALDQPADAFDRLAARALSGHRASRQPG
jgi:tetratricopeptide (TPR) repeat protein